MAGCRSRFAGAIARARARCALEQVPGYAELSWLARRRLMLGMIAAAPARPAFWRGLVWTAIGWAAAVVVTWRFDLAGWQRDGLRMLPFLLAAPFIAAARRDYVARRFGCERRDLAHRQSSSAALKE